MWTMGLKPREEWASWFPASGWIGAALAAATGLVTLVSRLPA
jgi:hypothetical protein